MVNSTLLPNRYALAIHTASPDLGLAISNFAGDGRCQSWNLGREVSSVLHLYLREFIQPQTWSDLDFIAVAKGPGGFTGTRLGVVTARTLAQQLNLPLFAISTLAAVAWTAAMAEARTKAGTETSTENQPEPSELFSLDVAVEMPAQRGEVHGAVYAIRLGTATSLASITPLLPDSVVSVERWQQILESWHRPYRLVPVENGIGHTAQSLLDLAYLDWQLGAKPHWSAALPFYGQSPV